MHTYNSGDAEIDVAPEVLAHEAVIDGGEE